MGAAAGSTTAAVVGTSVVVAMAASTALTAYGAVTSGDAAKEAADRNAAIQGKRAIQAENVGAQQAAEQKDKARRLAATQTAMGAAGGLETTSGTMGDIISETTKYGELDALRITNNAARQAWGYQAQAASEQAQGSQMQTAGYMQAGSSILGGLSNAYFGMQRFNAKAA